MLIRHKPNYFTYPELPSNVNAMGCQALLHDTNLNFSTYFWVIILSKNIGGPSHFGLPHIPIYTYCVSRKDHFIFEIYKSILKNIFHIPPNPDNNNNGSILEEELKQIGFSGTFLEYQSPDSINIFYTRHTKFK